MRKQDIIEKRAKKIFVKLGGVECCTFKKSPSPETVFVFKDLGYTCYIDKDFDTKIISIFGRFSSPRKDLGNQFSGKYNLHLFQKYPINDILGAFEQHIKNINK